MIRIIPFPLHVSLQINQIEKTAVNWPARQLASHSRTDTPVLIHMWECVA